MTLASRASLVVKVRQLANLESSQFVTDPEIAGYLDDGARELYDLLTECHATEYVERLAELSTLPIADPTVTESGYTYATLPPDFFSLLGVLYRGGASRDWQPMHPFGPGETAQLTAVRPAGAAYRYRIASGVPYAIGAAVAQSGPFLEIRPPAAETLALRIRYVPVLTLALTTGGDTSYEGQNGWELLAVYHAAALCVAKEDRDPSLLLSLKAGVEQRVRRLAGERNAASAPRLRDTEDEGLYFGIDAPWRAIPWR